MTAAAPHPAFADPRVVTVREYHSGWVAKAYKWPAPGNMTEHRRQPDGTFCSTTRSYDRKRQNADGPNWTAFSAAGGWLASG